MVRTAPRATTSSSTSVGPANYTLRLYRGDSYGWQFVLWSDTDKTQPVDLTDVTVAAQIRDRPGGTPVIDMTCTVTLPNTIAVDLDAADSQTAPSGGWDLQLTYSDGRVVTVLAGMVIVTPDITVLDP